MDYQSVAITGGAGFVGSNLACSFRRRLPRMEVPAIDSLRRLTFGRRRENARRRSSF